MRTLYIWRIGMDGKEMGMGIIGRDGVYSVDGIPVQSSMEYDINDVMELM